MQSPAKKEYYENRKPALKLVKNDNTVKKDREQYYLYYNSGIFPILLFIILFLCLAVIINIGLRIQNINYDKTIFNLKQAINVEKDRSDRLSLKISQLKSPSAIVAAIDKNSDIELQSENDINNNEVASNQDEEIKGHMTDSLDKNTEFRKLDVIYSQTAKEIKAVAVDPTDLNNDYNKNKIGENLKTVTSNIKEVLLVVSEGILTFFIP